jgi:hypothetical protein
MSSRSGSSSPAASDAPEVEHVDVAGPSNTDGPAVTAPPAAAEAEDAEAEDAAPEEDADADAGTPADAPAAGDWQAIFSPAHNAYYFFNAATQQTTWTNPLVPAAAAADAAPGPEPTPTASTSTVAEPSAEPAGSSSAAAVPPHLASLYAAQAAAAAQGIDPSLAFLDPTLSSTGGGGGAYAAAAKFNARTGAFTRNDARAPEHLGEHARAQRMSAFYFDSAAWEADVAKRAREEDELAEDGRAKKRLSKKDLVRARVCAFVCGGRADGQVRRTGSRSRRKRRSSPRRRGCGTEPCTVHLSIQ